jgi:hypothetical protein
MVKAIALGVRDRRHDACSAHVRDERHRKAEMEARGIAHRRIPRRQVGVNGERRLYIGESGNNDSPDTLGGVERQDSFVPLDQPPHHVRLARRTECGARFLRLFGGDEAIDDLPALHQKPVHRLVDAVDFPPQLAERRCFRLGRFHHDAFCRFSRARIDRSQAWH